MLKLIKPYITFHEVETEFQNIFQSGIFTKGENVKKFNDMIKVYTGADYTFLTTSATTALSLCLRILNIGQGDEVILSDFSFPATVNVVEDLGATPIFADVDKETFNMQPKEIENKLTDKTKAVIFVDALGNPSGILDIKEVCKKHDIPLIEDAACAMGSSVKGMKVGNIADLTCFSFHPRKLVTTGEGGAITTNNSKFADILRVKLNHGAISYDSQLDFIDFGYNYRLSELQTVMGIRQMQKLDKIINKRNKMKIEYDIELCPYGFQKQKLDDNVIHNVQSLTFVVPKGVNRDGLIKYLLDNDIEATLGTYCLSNTTFFKRKYNQVQPIAKYLEQWTITLPCHDDVNVKFVCDKIKKYLSIDGCSSS